MNKSHQFIYNSIISLGYHNDGLTYIYETGQGGKQVCRAFDLFKNIRDIEKTALASLGEKHRILDIGAGAGRISLYLQEKKFNITALEKSKVICGVLQKRGLDKVVNVDIFRYNPCEKYNTALFFDAWSILGKDKYSIDRTFTLLRKKILHEKSSIFFAFKNPFTKRDGCVKRRFILKSQKSFWFKSYFFDSDRLITAGKKYGWAIKDFYIDNSNQYFLILSSA